MSYQVFARRYRPKTFADVLGQDHVVRTLRNAIAQNRLAHAYLFVGPRGTGKTSTARIFAKALNCPGGPTVDFDPDDPACIEIAEGRSLDVLEIDGASNNRVDEVRQLIESAVYAPAHARFKIYYIDEVHMLSTAAFNALLKTLEEPPPHVKFIFATTEVHKLLPTIISRCQRFDLRKIPAPLIAAHLSHIATLENVKLDPDAAEAVARAAEGGMRDAQSMLDQLVAFCGQQITAADVREIFGITTWQTVGSLAGDLLVGNTAAALQTLQKEADDGKDLSKLLEELIAHFRNLLVFQVSPAAAVVELSTEAANLVNQQSKLVVAEKLLRAIDTLAETDGRMKWAPNKRMHFEIGLIKTVQSLQETSLNDVIGLITGGVENGSLDRPAAAPTKIAPLAVAMPNQESKAPVASMLPSLPPPPPKADPDPLPREESPEIAEKLPAPPLPPATQLEKTELVAPVAESPSNLEEPGEAAPWTPETLWNAALPEIRKLRPLWATWATAAFPLTWENGQLTLGFHPSQKMARDSLVRQQAWLQELVDRTTGEKVKLALVLSNDAPEAVIPEPISFKPEPAPATVTAPPPIPATTAGSGPARAASGLSVEEELNDPLIKDAMERFQARIVKTNK